MRLSKSHSKLLYEKYLGEKTRNVCDFIWFKVQLHLFHRVDISPITQAFRVMNDYGSS